MIIVAVYPMKTNLKGNNENSSHQKIKESTDCDNACAKEEIKDCADDASIVDSINSMTSDDFDSYSSYFKKSEHIEKETPRSENKMCPKILSMAFISISLARKRIAAKKIKKRHYGIYGYK